MTALRTGQKIADLRQKAGLTQQQLAEKLFISRELVSKWETDSRLPDDAAVKKLAGLFGVLPEDIADRNEVALRELSACFPPERELTEETLTALINSFLAALSKTERLIFISRYYHGHNAAETAGLLGLKEGYVRKRLTLVRKKLTDFAEK